MNLDDLDPDRPALVKTKEPTALQSQSEAFQDVSGCEFPRVPPASQLPMLSGSPDQFGKGIEDLEENFTDVIGSDPLQKKTEGAGFKSFEQEGLQKAAGSPILPVPSVKNVWKPKTPAGASTAQFWSLPPPGGEYPKDLPRETRETVPAPTAWSVRERDEVQKKMDLLFARLEELETKRARDTQTEILAFVGTGLFMLLSLDLLTRRRR